MTESIVDSTIGDDDRIALNFMVNGEVQNLITVYADGRIEKGAAFTTDNESSQKFWDTLFGSFPLWRKALIERAIADKIVQAAQEFEISLRMIASAGIGISTFDARSPAVMRARLENIIKLASAINEPIKVQNEETKN